MSYADDMIDDWLGGGWDDTWNDVGFDTPARTGYTREYVHYPRKRSTWTHPLDVGMWRAGGEWLDVEDMDENYVRNALAFLQKPENLEKMKSWERGFNSILYANLSIDEYLENRVKDSSLWVELTQAVEKFDKLKEEANKLNKGVLEL